LAAANRRGLTYVNAGALGLILHVTIVHHRFLECGDVIHYRAYSVGEHGHLVSAVDLVCPDDEAAIESAKLLVDRYDIEVWQGGRKVIRLVPQKRPHTWPRWRKM
jgi:hypothetical protein